MNFNLRNYYRMIVLIWTNIYFGLAFLDLAFYIFHFDPPIAIYSNLLFSTASTILYSTRLPALLMEYC